MVDAVEFINNEFELVLFVICLYVGNILNILRKLVEVLWEEPNFVAFSEYMNFTIDVFWIQSSIKLSPILFGNIMFLYKI